MAVVGDHTIGIYPLLQGETRWFLAVDFDKKTWQRDAAAFLAVCCELNVPAALERSCSGNGGHVWIFFDQAIPATTARKLGCATYQHGQGTIFVAGRGDTTDWAKHADGDLPAGNQLRDVGRDAETRAEFFRAAGRFMLRILLRVAGLRRRPLLQALHEWFEVSLTKLFRKSDTTAAVRYALGL